MKVPVLLLAVALFFFACNKERNELTENTNRKPETQIAAGAEVPFLIQKGSHNCTGNGFVPVSLLEQKFTVRFDSSAIYKTTIPLNRLDINKLYGFSDNGALHHDFSARFGWRWSDGALRLFAYVYNEGKVTSAEISTIDIGKNIACALRVKGALYEFEVADKIMTMPRSSTAATATGYLLYPYFGGDEAAPHDVRIWIKNL